MVCDHLCAHCARHLLCELGLQFFHFRKLAAVPVHRGSRCGSSGRVGSTALKTMSLSLSLHISGGLSLFGYSSPPLAGIGPLFDHALARSLGPSLFGPHFGPKTPDSESTLVPLTPALPLDLGSSQDPPPRPWLHPWTPRPWLHPWTPRPWLHPWTPRPWLHPWSPDPGPAPGPSNPGSTPGPWLCAWTPDPGSASGPPGPGSAPGPLAARAMEVNLIEHESC